MRRGAHPGPPSQNETVQRPVKTDIDAADPPLTVQHPVIHIVFVDAVAKAGGAQLERHFFGRPYRGEPADVSVVGMP